MKDLTVIRGTLKNKRIPLPKPVKGHSNATPQKIKEAVFNILDSRISSPGDYLFLDLFAGSGQMGLEALSLGYGKVVFCEWDRPRNVKLIEWLRSHTTDSNWKIVRADAFEILRKLSEVSWLDFEKVVIFADPPYSFQRQNKNTFEVLARDFNRQKAQMKVKEITMLMQAPLKLGHYIDPKEDPEQVESQLEKLSTKVYHYGKNRVYLFE